MKLDSTVPTAQQAAKIRPILDRTFRANPGYELVCLGVVVLALLHFSISHWSGALLTGSELNFTCPETI